MTNQNHAEASSSLPNHGEPVQHKRGRPSTSATSAEQTRESSRVHVSNWRRSLTTEQRRELNARRTQSRSLLTLPVVVEVRPNEPESINQANEIEDNPSAGTSQITNQNQDNPDQHQTEGQSSLPSQGGPVQHKRGRPLTSTTPTEQTRESTRVRVNNWRHSLTAEQRSALNARRIQSHPTLILPSAVHGGPANPEHPHQPNEIEDGSPVPTSRTGRRNIARNYRSSDNVRVFQLPQPTICPHCAARLFHKETKNLCCKLGKVILPAIPVPPQLLALYTDQTTRGRHFRQNIRAYNHVFSFTSMGVTLDETLPAFNQGLYTFRAHGAIYHKIGSLLPTPGNRPRFLQMFIYDTEHETSHRLAENNGLDTEILNEIKDILDTHNPYVKTFRQIAQHTQLQSFQLLIRERTSTDRQYILPTASQVAAVLVGAEDFAESTDRDIKVHSTSGHLTTVREYSGFYDPLQYPLLLSQGTFGWDLALQTDQGLRVSCCDYYACLLQVINFTTIG
ncbi:hypothetical protein KSP39_PZI003646 [Platanthera zijinensis]|uniref:Helitron helicase-like domain-containing protein n=1 Tax=Platanthera zijinensis TaxID=2320716 RepID=A0AAP0BXS5_9ASPA